VAAEGAPGESGFHFRLDVLNALYDLYAGTGGIGVSLQEPRGAAAGYPADHGLNSTEAGWLGGP